MEKEYKNLVLGCQNCRKEFTIESEDFNFYEKIKVPPPTFCPECRFQRRLMWRNERSLYHQKCELCGKNTISMYSSEKPFSVYCHNCWWSDKWDPLRYGRNYDFSKPFLEQFKELMLRIPQISLIQRDIVNSPYTNWPIRTKNSYLVFGGHDIEDSAYISMRSHFLKNCFDISYSYSSELCYECTNVSKCYSLLFSQDCENCSSSTFLFNCRNCQDCFGCANLRNKTHCIFNEQYSREEYQQKLKKMNAGSFKYFKVLEKQFRDFMLSVPRKYAMILQSNNVTGDNIAKTKNCRNCFLVSLEMEDSAYLWLNDRTKDSYDISVGYSLELGYEGLSTLEGRDIKMSVASWTNYDVVYINNCHASSECFGCVSLRSKQYCILNKQYTKEEYEELVPKIIKHMNDMPYIDSKGRIYRYGEFFPPELSPFAYNETIAQEYFPLTKEEALKQGYKWKEKEERNYQIDIKNEDIPDDIKEVKDEIINKVIECLHESNHFHPANCGASCTEAYKIIEPELQFYRRMNLPLPRLCPNCRHYERLAQRNPLKLWHRKCMKQGCPNEFETSYAPERPEIIYCEGCYNKEVY